MKWRKIPKSCSQFVLTLIFILVHLIFTGMPSIQEFEEKLQLVSSKFQIQEDFYSLEIDGENNFKKLDSVLKEHGIDYVVRHSYLNRRKKETKSRLLWQDDVLFVINNVIRKTCALGPKKIAKKKTTTHVENGHPTGKKKRFRLQPSRKISCPARMKITEVLCYPEYRICENASNVRKLKAEKLKLLAGVLQTESLVITEKKFRITLSKPSVHSHSNWSSFLNQQLSNELKDKVNQYVNEGITHIRTIQKLLKSYVENNVSKSIPASSRSFYPTRKILYNHVLKYTYQTRASKIDQVALQKKIEDWDASVPGNYYYRWHNESMSQTFMLCVQLEEHQHLLKRYRSVVLLDATYKTSRYALPLFSLVVKTNVGYIVCGIFIIQYENSKSIAEALNVFKQWNSEWVPEYFIVDFSEAEMNAIESTFTFVKIYICDFHREQSWTRWFSKKENVQDSSDSDKLKLLFRKLATSKTETEFESNLLILMNTEEYTRNPKVEKYLKNTWLPHKDKWTQAFFDQKYSVIIRTNNGIESQNKLIKYSYLKLHVDKSLCGVLDVLITDFFIDEIKKYQVANSRLSENCKQYDKEIPEYLHNRPVDFIRHEYARYASGKTFDKDDISVLNNAESSKCICLVRSEESPTNFYYIDFDVPNCTCEDFFRHFFPCKHMFAVFQFLPEQFSFEKSLPPSYLNSPFLTIDEKFSFFETEF
ncbi:uncharacterized protein LOC135842015 [Planococcus citri]|uniref:uncharacterized protein LOC135842015 n=1 Tax=Planococcus citri TaxID=170843 RepID=UPI0031F96573